MAALAPHAVLMAVAALRLRKHGAGGNGRQPTSRIPAGGEPPSSIPARKSPPLPKRKHRWPVALRLMGLAIVSWKRDKVPRMGAALAYYALFAMAPVLLVVIAVAGLVWGQEAVRGQIVGEIDQMLGRDGARVVQDMLAGVSRPREGMVATIIGSATFLVAVSGAFLELQHVLNFIWRVKPKAGVAIKRMLLNRLRSFGLVVTLAFLILTSLAASAALTALSEWAGSRMGSFSAVWPLIGEVVTFAVITMLFAAVYKVLPDVQLQWRHVWIGGAVTALFFVLGKFLIGLYIAKTNTASTYGAAAAVAVILIWVYYTTQIVLLGAEFTRVQSRGRGALIRPEPYAKPDGGESPTEPKRKEAR